jgi:NAD(P)-dependent dehydrogenase (short-subunit alcohol dehydrogenase family)
MGTREKLNLSGHKALITGSSQGIGAALALSLAEFGADVVIHCNTEIDKANAIADKARTFGVNAQVIVCNLMEKDASEKLFELATNAIGEIDILVLNAAIHIRRKWYDVTLEEFDQHIQVNLKNSFFTIQRFSKSMIEKGWGRIITMGSVQQHIPHVDMIIYAASKSAQENIVRNMAKQISDFGVTINNLEIGVFNTPQNQGVLSNPEYKTKVLGKIPTGFIAEPEDCCGLVNLICSEAGRYITGANLAIDGGMHINA